MCSRWATSILYLALAAAVSAQPRVPSQTHALLEQRKWKEAAQELRAALKEKPGDPGGRMELAIALWGAGERQGALEEIRQLLNQQPGLDEARIVLGLMLQQNGQPADAAAQYQAVLKHNPDSAKAQNWLGVAYMQQNALAQAATAFRQAIKLQPEMVQAYSNLGSTLAQAGDLEEAIAAFRAGLHHAPENLELHRNLGIALRGKGDTAEAIRYLEIVRAGSPDEPEIHYQLGQTLRQQGNLERGIAEFESALELDPEYRESYYILGQTLKQLAARGRKNLSPAVNAVAAEHVSRGLALGRSGDLKAAIESLRKAVAAAPEMAPAHYHLGAALWYANEPKNAAAEFDQAIRADPAAAEAYSFRALAHREAGDLPAARRLLQRAIALNPESPAAYFDLAVVFLRMSRAQQALGQFEAGLNIAGLRAPPDLDTAIRELQRASTRSEDAEVHYVLGRLLGLAGADSAQVAAAFEGAVRLRPNYAEAHNSLGLVFTQAGDDEKAIAAFRNAIRYSPGFADAHANLGAILTATDPVEAVAELEKALALQPKLLKAEYNLALAFGASPKHGVDKEVEQLRKLIALEPGYPRAEFQLGKALLYRGQVPEAADHLARAVQLEPDFGEAHYQHGLALVRAGRQPDAETELRRGRELIAAAQKQRMLELDMSEGKAALERGDTDLAVAKFRQVTNELPQAAYAHFHLGLALEQKGDSQGAEASFRQVLELDPGHAGARERLSQLPGHRAALDDPRRIEFFESFVRQRKFKEVELLLEGYLGERPNSSWGWYALGYAQFAQQKVGDSIRSLSRSLALNVTNAEAHKVLGRSLMAIGRFDAAQREFEQGVKYDPRSAEMHYNLGRLFSIQDQWPQAREAFAHALGIDASYAEAADGLGFALEALGEDELALASYEKAARLNEERKGSFAAPYVNLSAYYNRTGNTEAALVFARKALQVNPQSDRGWFQLARAHERRSELDAAFDALHRAISINAAASSYHYVLAAVSRRLGKEKESREAMETFSRLEKESNKLEEIRRQVLGREGARE